MKLINLIWIIIIMVSSCSKDSYEPIQLHYATYNDKPNPIENNQVNLLFRTSDKTQLVIFGGDGHYTISNSDATIANVTLTNNSFIDIIPLSTGNSTVTITDNSGGSYTLNITILHRKTNIIIDKQDVIVIGDKLSEEQKAEIQQKAALTLPVKVMGGFSFVYNLGEEVNKGQVFIYNDKFGGEAVESVFEFKQIKIEINRFTQTHPVYVITINGKQREFIVNKYVAPKSKGDMIVPMSLNEDLTELFKADYPDVESVYTQQRIINPK